MVWCACVCSVNVQWCVELWCPGHVSLGFTPRLVHRVPGYWEDRSVGGPLCGGVSHRSGQVHRSILSYLVTTMAALHRP